MTLRDQLVIWRRTLDGGAARIGWKIGFNVPQVQRQLGLEEAAVGHLTTATQLAPGGVFDAGEAVHLRAEAEVALEVGDDLAVRAIAPAIELVDVGRPPEGGAAAIVAENIFHRGFALGTPVPPGTPVVARLVVGGVDHPPEQPVPDPAATVELVARQLEAAGERLMPGDWIISGALVHVAAEPGEVLVDLGPAGAVAVTVQTKKNVMANTT